MTASMALTINFISFMVALYPFGLQIAWLKQT